MVSTRVIRIDQQVWTELQRRGVAFEDNPNSVLRRLLGLSTNRLSETAGSGAGVLDPRIARLLALVEARVGESPDSSPTRTGQSRRFKSKRGYVVGFIYAQKRRLKVESNEHLARNAGINNWDHWLRNGWWNQDNSVYWHVPDDDDDSGRRVADVLDRLWRQ